MSFAVCEVNQDVAIHFNLGTTVNAQSRLVPDEDALAIYSRDISKGSDPVDPPPTIESSRKSFFTPIIRKTGKFENNVYPFVKMIMDSLFYEDRQSSENRAQVKRIDLSGYRTVHLPNDFEVVFPSENFDSVIRIIQPDSETGLIGIHTLDAQAVPTGHFSQSGNGKLPVYHADYRGLPSYSGSKPVWFKPDGEHKKTYQLLKLLARGMDGSMPRLGRIIEKMSESPSRDFKAPSSEILRSSGYVHYLNQYQPRLVK